MRDLLFWILAAWVLVDFCIGWWVDPWLSLSATILTALFLMGAIAVQVLAGNGRHKR